MRAVTCTRYGPATSLAVRDVPVPVPKAGEILLRVCAVEVTKSDCEIRAMTFPVRWFAWPLRLALGWRRPKNPVLGAYFSGRIESLGNEVEGRAVGDEVYGSSGLRFGAYAEYVCVPSMATLVGKPRNLSFAEAAAIPLGGWNALHFMRRARISPGERALIIGAGGSIGSYAVQLAKHFGAHVTAVDAPHKLDWLRRLGADQAVDYTKTDALAAPEAYDVVFSTVAGDHYGRCLRALTPRGRYLTANPRLFDLLRSLWTNLTSHKRVIVAFAAETKEELEALRALAEAGELRSTLDRVLPLEDAAAAHERVETEARVGAVVLEPGPARALAP